MDGAILTSVFVGLGAMAAGVGIFRAGVSFGKAAERVPRALESQSESQKVIAQAQERQAAAVEHQLEIWPLVEELRLERQQISRTLRIMARKLGSKVDEDET